MIEQQMKSNDLDNFSDEGEEKGERGEPSFDGEGRKNKIKDLPEIEEEAEEKKNPNIFKRLVPEYQNLLFFADTPVNSSLLHCDSEYRIYELPSKEEETIILKFFTVLPYPKALIFQAIAS